MVRKLWQMEYFMTSRFFVYEEFCYVAQTGLRFFIFLPPTSEYGCTPLGLAEALLPCKGGAVVVKEGLHAEVNGSGVRGLRTERGWGSPDQLVKSWNYHSSAMGTLFMYLK